MYGYGGMYGGGMGMGMGSGLYGSGAMGGYGMGGGMYGNSMYGGMNSGLYNSGLSSGLYNNNNIANTYGSNSNNGLLGSSTFGNNNNNNNNGNSLLDNNANSANNQGVGLLPAPPSSFEAMNANEPSSPINQIAALPPLNEDPAQRARRLRNEKRKRRQLIKQHRDQLRQVKMKARLEILGHFTNVLVQTLRSTMELFAVCFGTYYSMKAVRAFSGAQQVPPGYVRAPNGQLIPALNGNNANIQTQQQSTSNYNNTSSNNIKSTGTQQSAASQNSGGQAIRSKWKQWLIFTSLMFVGEILYQSIRRAWVRRQSNLMQKNNQRLPYNQCNCELLEQADVQQKLYWPRHHQSQQGSHNGLLKFFTQMLGVNSSNVNVYEHDSIGSLSQQQLLLEEDDETHQQQLQNADDTMEKAYQSALEQTSGTDQNAHGNRHDANKNNLCMGDNNGSNRRIYIAMYDYDGSKEGDEFATFKSGDEFVVDEYVDDGWCEAVRFDDNTHINCRGVVLVPGNFLRPLETSTKL